MNNNRNACDTGGGNTELDKVFHALADPTRRAILSMVAVAPCSISEAAAPHKISLAAISKHVRVLENAGLLHRHREGRKHILVCDSAAMHEASHWLHACEDVVESA